MGRITSGMLRADPDAPESPQGRTNRSTAGGIVVAVLLCAAAFVWGMISPGQSGSWRDAKNLIVDQDTGASYLYVDGRLRPVRNYTSARLIGGPKMKTVKVRTKSLNGEPHGQPVGISGAPASLPGSGDLSRDPWSVCTGSDGNGSATSATTLAVGVGAADDDAPLTAGEGMLVTGPDSTVYLVWQGSRLRVNQKGGALSALGYAGRTPAPVSAAFLDALPAGPDLAAPAVPGMGTAGPALEGRATRIGQVFKVGVIGSAPRYYQLRQNGLTGVSAMVADLTLGDAKVRRLAYGGHSGAAVTLPPDAVNGHLAPADPAASAGAQPETPPRLVDRGTTQATCVRVAPGISGPRVSVAMTDPAALGMSTQAAASTACVPVERITAPPGGGVLVHALAAGGGAGGGTTYLVTDLGTKYRVPSDGDLAALGYSSGEAVALPSTLLAMLPTGPDLSGSNASSGVSTPVTEPCAPGGQGGDKPTTSRKP